MKQVVNLASKRRFFDKLDECKKREYAAIEAETLGYGGLSAVHRAIGMSIATIRKGVSESRQGTNIPSNRIRKSGGGRKKNA